MTFPLHICRPASPHYHSDLIPKLKIEMKGFYDDESDIDDETREFRAKCIAAKKAAKYRRDQEEDRRRFERNGNTLEEAAREISNRRRIIEITPSSNSYTTGRRSNNSTEADHQHRRVEPRRELVSPVTERARGPRNTGASGDPATGGSPSTRRTHRVARTANETGTGISASSTIPAERGGRSYSAYTSER